MKNVKVGMVGAPRILYSIPLKKLHCPQNKNLVTAFLPFSNISKTFIAKFKIAQRYGRSPPELCIPFLCLDEGR